MKPTCFTLFILVVCLQYFVQHSSAANCTKSNEVQTTCYESECRPTYCSDVGYPLNNCEANPKKCTTRCICKPQYVYNNGYCIPAKNCSSCGGDRYAVYGCGNHCLSGDDCALYGKTGYACAQYCEQNGCDCKPNYYYNSETKKCGPLSACPKESN